MGRKLFLLWLALWVAPLVAQTECAPTPVYSPCDVVFDLNDSEAAAHPNPYVRLRLHAEFRSPRHRTFLMPAFWDGGRRVIIRFSPTEAGEWIYRLTSNLERFNGKQGKFTATEAAVPGFVVVRNVHHFAYTENNKPHLWMGDTCYRFAFIDRAVFQQMIDARATQKFNHIRGLAIGGPEETAKIFAAPDQVDPAHFRELDERLRYMNGKGIVADLILGADENHLAKLFPTWQQRENFIRYMVARYSAMNITWQIVQEYEEYENGRELLREVGQLLKKMDPYQHLRSTHTTSTSAPLLPDGWMDYTVYQTSDDAINAIEHQLYAVPQVNAEFAYEDSGAGKSHPHHVDTDTFRHRLWNATMNGQYPTFGNTGTYGGRKFPVDPKYLDSPAAKQMTVWFDFFSKTRHWELEPYFDVDGGKALALESAWEGAVEYVVYVEKPALLEVQVEKRGYNIAWFNPITGEYIRQKDFKGERFTGEPPDKTHDWVLHIFREGKKESMLQSYKFESRRILLQEIEQSTEKTPFAIVEPAKDPLPVGAPAPYAIKFKRETRATRSMLFLWTGEVVADGQGYRVLATGPKGEWKFPPGLARNFPALLNLRLLGMNANGKVYSIDKPYQLIK